MARLKILKTYKLFIGGQFPRSESGRYYELRGKKGNILANVSMASRKDFRNAVSAAREAQVIWGERSAYNRAQILYRIAEMLEGRNSQFVEELMEQGLSKGKALNEVALSIDRLVYYAGWCDKYQQIFSSVNPVSSPHYNFSVPEPMGVVAILAPEDYSLLGAISCIAPAIAGANSCVLLASESLPLAAISFAEVLAHSDLPPGLVNLLSGSHAELRPHFSSHMEVNALVYCGKDKKVLKQMEETCSLNLKRFFNWNYPWQSSESQNPFLIQDLQEIKTTWHPIERLARAGGGY